MTLLTVVRDVCAAIGVAAPTSVMNSINTNRTMFEMLALANEMAQRIAYDTREWTALKTTATFVGDGVITHEPGDPPEGVMRGTTAFNLPNDYKKMLLTANVWRTNYSQAPMQFVPDTDQWLRRRMSGSCSSFGEWTILGGQMHIFPIMPLGVSATFPYLNRNCILRSDLGFSDEFSDDGDSYILEERLLKLGVLWQWKAQKGSPYAEDMGTYSDALVNAMAPDSPAPILIDRLPIGWSTVGGHF